MVGDGAVVGWARSVAGGVVVGGSAKDRRGRRCTGVGSACRRRGRSPRRAWRARRWRLRPGRARDPAGAGAPAPRHRRRRRPTATCHSWCAWGPPRCGPRHPAAKRSTQAPKFENVAARVGTVGRGDGHHLGNTRGRDVTRVGIDVPGGRHVRDPGLDRPAYSSVEYLRSGRRSHSRSRPRDGSRSRSPSRCRRATARRFRSAAQSSTRTDTSDAAGALPLVAPPIAPATSVPCRAQSSPRPDAVRPHRHPSDARPSKSGSATSNAAVEQIHAHTRFRARRRLIRIVERQESLIDTIESPGNRVAGRGGAGRVRPAPPRSRADSG